MKKKTKIILLVVAILVIIGIVAMALMFTANTGHDTEQEDALVEELDSVTDLLNDYPIDYENLDKKLTTTVTTGDYAKVEKAIKNYSKDFIDYMRQFEELTKNETLRNAANIENIKADGPDFVNTKKVLSESKTTVDTILANSSNYLTEEVALSYIKDSGLDEYYTDFYKKYVLGDNLDEMKTAKEQIEKSLKDVKTLIEVYEEIINFLAENKESWEVENDQVVFESETLVSQYNALVAKLSEIG